MGRVFSVLAVLAVLMLAALAFLSIRPLALPSQVEPLADWLSERGRLGRAEADLKPDITHARTEDAERPVVEDLTSRGAVAHVAIDERGQASTQAAPQDTARESVAPVVVARPSTNRGAVGDVVPVTPKSAPSRTEVAPPLKLATRAASGAVTRVQPVDKPVPPSPRATRVAKAAPSQEAEPADAYAKRAQTPRGQRRPNNPAVAVIAPTALPQSGDQPKTAGVESAARPVARGLQTVKATPAVPLRPGRESAGRSARLSAPTVAARSNQDPPLKLAPASARVAPLPAVATATEVTAAPAVTTAPRVAAAPSISAAPKVIAVAPSVDTAPRVAAAPGAIEQAQQVATRDPSTVDNSLAGGAPGLTGSSAAASAVLAASAVQAAGPVARQSDSTPQSAPQQVALIPPTAPAAEPRSPRAVAQQVSIKNYLTGRVVEFQVGRDRLTRRGLAVLDQLVPLIDQNPQTTIVIQGHTDDVGDEASNLELSGARAIAARAYLMSRGIDGARLKVQGFGELRPIADNTTENGRIRNRRIDFAVSDPG